MNIPCVPLLLVWTGVLSAAMAAETIRLDTLDFSQVKQGWGTPQINRSIREKPLTIGGKVYEYGVGLHASTDMWVDLTGGSEAFSAEVGVDDAAGAAGTITCKFYGDGKKLWDSGIMKWGEPAKSVQLDLRGCKMLLIQIGDAGDGISYDHADLASASFSVIGAKPRLVASLVEKPYLLTPKAGKAPRINGPMVYGCRPGNPFIYRMPVTGERPMAFSVTGLPQSIKINPETGILTGVAPEAGEYKVTFQAKNNHGKATRSFKIVSGATLALTPPMGYNHWYYHYDHITEQLMREAADVMVSSGMADVGYQYVNIDDCWMNAAQQKDPLRVGPLRDTNGSIIPNKHFPDIKGMVDYIHGKGLKAGIYTSPGPRTCAGFAGAYGFEENDARQFAAWGFDFLKYDWCSYDEVVKGDHNLDTLKRPYKQMGDLLKQQPRDIVFNLCQYGMGDVWKWGSEVGGHCWRTAGDLGFELNRIYEVALKNAEYRDYSHPGSWNDPDYIQIGYIGDANDMGAPKACPLTPSEQYSFMSLWCLMAAPLFYSGDMGRLDEFTINVLCNPEVIEVDQDALGQCARVVKLDGETFAMVKDMVDGSKAVGLFNHGEMSTHVKVTWPALGIDHVRKGRDLWRQHNLGRLRSGYEVELPRHGSVLLRVWSKPE